MSTEPPTFAEVLQRHRDRLAVAREMHARPGLAGPVQDYWHGRMEALQVTVEELEQVEAWR
jgi:hypothetical protein